MNIEWKKIICREIRDLSFFAGGETADLQIVNAKIVLIPPLRSSTLPPLQKKLLLRPSKKKNWLASFFQKIYGQEGGFYFYFLF